MFSWGHIGSHHQGPPVVLRWRGTEVARLWQHIGTGAWFAILDQHLPWNRRRDVACTDLERGRAGVEAWAQRHSDRLAREIAAWSLAHPPHRAVVGTKWEANALGKIDY